MYTKEDMTKALEYLQDNGQIRVYFMPYENYEYEPEFSRLEVVSVGFEQPYDNEYLDIFVEIQKKKERIMSKYWWIIRTDINYGLPYDTFIKW